jgi:hypothetical protein
MKQLFSTAPKPDAGVFPCRCAEKGGGCLANRYGVGEMWAEYHCVLRVSGVVYKRDEDGNVPRHVEGDPARSPIQRRP